MKPFAVFAALAVAVLALLAISTHADTSDPTMVANCTMFLWVCDFEVYTNGFGGLTVLAVDTTYMNRWEALAVEGGWGMRIWFDPPECAGQYSRVRLYGFEDVPDPTAEPRPTLAPLVEPAGTVSRLLASKDLYYSCGFVPLVKRGQ